VARAKAVAVVVMQGQQLCGGGAGHHDDRGSSGVQQWRGVATSCRSAMMRLVSARDGILLSSRSLISLFSHRRLIK
jgi:hypothetical protein